MSTNITPDLKAKFDALASGKFSNFALFSCFIDSKPGAAIVAVNQEEPGGEVTITPLFVSITEGMVLTDHEGVPA